MERFADFIIERRNILLGVLIVVTAFFFYEAANVSVETVYKDLLPQQHEYIKVHNEIRGRFGGANQVRIMVQVRKGGEHKDIFNTDSLKKVQYITKELLKFTAVDRFKILSIAHRKVRDFRITTEGYVNEYIMFPDVPETQEGLDRLRLTVYGSPMCYPALVSMDSKSAMISVDFFENKINYETTFKELQALRKKVEDENNIVAIAGEPMHLGYIFSYVKDVLKVLLYTVLAMLVVFYFYFRTKRGMILPILAAAVSATWGIGFLGILGFNLDPLVLVFPFLIAARAASHSVQIVKRYHEEVYRLGSDDAACKQACKNCIAKLFMPGFVGILTDALGIMIIALTPMRILQKITISCGFWAFATVAIVMLLVPILLSYMPLRNYHPKESILDNFMQLIGRWISRSGRYVICVVAVILFIIGTRYSGDIIIGNAVPGSEILWPHHRYNVDSFRIIFSMPLLNPLYVIADTKEHGGVVNADRIREVERFTKHMSRMPGGKIVFAQSIIAPLPNMHKGTRESDPNWTFLPDMDLRTTYLLRGITNRSPGSFDQFMDIEEQNLNIILYCRDKTAPNIIAVFDRIKKYIADYKPVKGSELEYRLAGGAVGVQAAINETLTYWQPITHYLALLMVFIFCTILFRSFIAGIVIMIPLYISTTLAYAFMVLNNPPLPLTTATLPVASVGIGLGVDYGIYLVSRLVEEFKNTGSYEEAVIATLGTTGKAIFYSATTLMCGLVFWFFSKLMFQALMGLLLAIILVINMLGALLMIPSIVLILKPKFLKTRSEQL